jgi:hypothetical protein
MVMPPAVVKEPHGLLSPVWQFPPTAAASPPPSGPPASPPLVLPPPELPLAPLGLPALVLVLAPLVAPVPPPFVLPLLLATPLEPLLDPALPPDAAGPWLPLPEEATPFPVPPLPGEGLLQPAWTCTTARLVARSVNFGIEILE